MGKPTQQSVDRGDVASEYDKKEEKVARKKGPQPKEQSGPEAAEREEKALKLVDEELVR